MTQKKAQFEFPLCPLCLLWLILLLRIRKLLVILLDQFLVTLRDLVFLRRADVFLCQKKLQVPAEFQLDTPQWIENLLRHFLDRLGIGGSRVTCQSLDGSGNLVEFSGYRIVPAQAVLDIPDFVQTLLEFPLPLARII
jgi:hypothetical protein